MKSKSSSNEFLDELVAPAKRALEREGITSLVQLSKRTEVELLQLHGLGPSTLPKLRKALKKVGLTLKK